MKNLNFRTRECLVKNKNIHHTTTVLSPRMGSASGTSINAQKSVARAEATKIKTISDRQARGTGKTQIYGKVMAVASFLSILHVDMLETTMHNEATQTFLGEMANGGKIKINFDDGVKSSILRLISYATTRKNSLVNIDMNEELNEKMNRSLNDAIEKIEDIVYF